MFLRRKDISIHALFDVNCDASSGTGIMTRDNHSLHSRPHIIPFCQMSREPRKHVILAIESKKVIVVQGGKNLSKCSTIRTTLLLCKTEQSENPPHMLLDARLTSNLKCRITCSQQCKRTT